MSIIHYPRLDTVMNVEELLRKAGKPVSKNEIDRRLKKKTMRQTLNLILDYLESKGSIAYTKQGVLWIDERDISKRLRMKLRNAVRVA
jgi:hypothetical protein